MTEEIRVLHVFGFLLYLNHISINPFNSPSFGTLFELLGGNEPRPRTVGPPEPGDCRLPCSDDTPVI